MSDFSAIADCPDISFIDDKTVDDVKGEMVAAYEGYMSVETGTAYSLPRVHPMRMAIYAVAAQIYQAMQYIDRAGKQGMLKYSYSGFVDNLGLLKGVTRADASPAQTTLRFTASTTRNSATAIPQGTRVATSGGIYFETDEYAEIPALSTTVDVSATCTVAGTDGNGLAVGELSTIVDPIAYVASVTNTTATEGGAEIESDEELAERIFLAPGAYSTAGPEDGYLYHAKQYSASVGDVVATSDQDAGTVDIVFLMDDGTSPGTEMIAGLKEYLQDGNIRPMTDLVTVAAPTEVSYTIALSYYINRSDSARAVTIQTAVAAAVDEYTTWQRAIGQDINPSKLGALIMAAGAKRVDITTPVHTVVAATSVAKLTTSTVTYGGLEDD